MSIPMRYFEDFIVGSTIEVGTRTLTEQEIVEFATQFDPQPFHVDAAAARKSIYGGIIASGWHTCSIVMRLMVDGLLKNSSSIGSPGVDEIRWLKPVRPGDTIAVSGRVLEAHPSVNKPDRGVIHTVWEGRNQHNELVVTIKGIGMFLRKP